jgi:hypothetical protein
VNILGLKKGSVQKHLDVSLIIIDGHTFYIKDVEKIGNYEHVLVLFTLVT